MNTRTNLFEYKLCFRTQGEKLEINAYEYSRRVPSIKSIDLGHCVHRMEELFPGLHVQKKWLVFLFFLACLFFFLIESTIVKMKIFFSYFNFNRLSTNALKQTSIM